MYLTCWCCCNIDDLQLLTAPGWFLECIDPAESKCFHKDTTIRTNIVFPAFAGAAIPQNIAHNDQLAIDFRSDWYHDSNQELHWKYHGTSLGSSQILQWIFFLNAPIPVEWSISFDLRLILLPGECASANRTVQDLPDRQSLQELIWIFLLTSHEGL